MLMIKNIIATIQNFVYYEEVCNTVYGKFSVFNHQYQMVQHHKKTDTVNIEILATIFIFTKFAIKGRIFIIEEVTKHLPDLKQHQIVGIVG